MIQEGSSGAPSAAAPTAAAADHQSITLEVRDQGSAEGIHFKVKKTAKLLKVFLVFCTKKGLDPEEMRFMHEGVRLRKQQTPAQVGMEDGDVIEALTIQLGGG